jgi:hypothetical protein
MEVAPSTIVLLRIYYVTLCHTPENQYYLDEEHLLYCPKLDIDKQVLKNIIKLYWYTRTMIR